MAIMSWTWVASQLSPTDVPSSPNCPSNTWPLDSLSSLWLVDSMFMLPGLGTTWSMHPTTAQTWLYVAVSSSIVIPSKPFFWFPRQSLFLLSCLCPPQILHRKACRKYLGSLKICIDLESGTERNQVMSEIQQTEAKQEWESQTWRRDLTCGNWFLKLQRFFLFLAK